MKKFVCLGWVLLMTNAWAIDLGKFKNQIQSLQQNIQHKSQNNPSTSTANASATHSPICNAVNTNKLCYAFTGPTNTDSKTAKGNEFACQILKGQYQPSGTCPTVGAFGKCAILKGQPKEYFLFYYEGGRFGALQARGECKNKKSSLHAQGPGDWSGI